MTTNIFETQITDKVLWMPLTNKNWWQEYMAGNPEYITIHETGNLNPGANAKMHANYVFGGGGRDMEQGGNNFGVSFHATVDDTESYQMLRWNMRGYHSGDGRGDGGMKSIGIETCQIGDWAKTIEHLTTLVIKLQKLFPNITNDKVVQHNKWSGKDCPQYLRSGKMPGTSKPGITWDQFKSGLDTVDRGFPGIVQPDRTLKINSEIVPNGIADVAEKLALQVYNEKDNKHYWIVWDGHAWQQWHEGFMNVEGA